VHENEKSACEVRSYHRKTTAFRRKSADVDLEAKSTLDQSFEIIDYDGQAL
jgi:hypothetical protein